MRFNRSAFLTAGLLLAASFAAAQGRNLYRNRQRLHVR